MRCRDKGARIRSVYVGCMMFVRRFSFGDRRLGGVRHVGLNGQEEISLVNELFEEWVVPMID
jgi:hypothetical protein